MSNITEDLRGLRARLGLSQEELATRLGVSFATVNRWESGAVKPQRAQQEAIQKLMDASAVEGKPLTESNGIASRSSRIRRGVSKSTILSTKSMEQMLWDAACSIRGEKDAPKFKDYIIPLLFIKRLSDVFDDEIQRLSETYGDRETALAVLEADHGLVRFYIPPEARWLVVSGRQSFDWPEVQRPKSLGEQLTTTIRAIVKHNPSLAGVIDIVDYNETRNGEREVSDAALKGVIEALSDPRYRLGLHDVEPDFLGRCYEYLLRKFAEGQGQSAGEFFTPTEVGFLMAEIMRPRPGEECYDFACGSFGLLIKLQLVCRRLDPLSKAPLKLYGQELTGSSYAIACMNRIIHDMEGEILRGDSMRNPKFRESDTGLKKFDLVVANPMWNQPFEPDVYENDAFSRFEQQGGITTSKGDWAWLQHAVASMKEAGRAAVVIDTGAVARGSGGKNEDKERNIRKWFVEQDIVDGVILLPDNLFYNTSAPGVILVLRKNKPKDRKGKMVLINASREFRKGAPKNYLTDEGIKKIADVFLKGQPNDGFAAVITNEEAAKNDFNLSPSRYLTSNHTGEYQELPALISRLAILDAESARVDRELEDLLTQLNQLEKQEKLIATTRELKRSATHQLLTSGVRSGPQKDTEAGPIPSTWNLKRLEECCEVVGSSISYTDFAAISETLDVDSITAMGIKVSDMNLPGNEYHLVRANLQKRIPRSLAQKKLVPPGTVVFPKRGAAIATNKKRMTTAWTVLDPNLIGVRSGEGVDPFFLFYWFQSFDLRTITEPGPTPQLNKKNLNPVLLPHPSDLQEQSKIAGILQKIDLKLLIHDRKRATLHELFQALLNQLMSGEIRVHRLDIDVSEIRQ